MVYDRYLVRLYVKVRPRIGIQYVHSRLLESQGTVSYRTAGIWQV